MNTRDRVVAVLSRAAGPIGMTALCRAVGRPRAEVRAVLATVELRRRQVSGAKEQLRHVIVRAGATMSPAVRGSGDGRALVPREGGTLRGLGRRGWRNYAQARSAFLTQREQQRQHHRRWSV